jgi:hypothetical protein
MFDGEVKLFLHIFIGLRMHEPANISSLIGLVVALRLQPVCIVPGELLVALDPSEAADKP